MKQVNGVSKLFDIKNRNIVITGSSGLLGSQYADTLSAAGANVILVDLDSAKNKKLENSLVKKYGIKAKSYITDISNLQEVKKLAKNVLRDFKKVDGLINNASNNPKVEENVEVNFSRLENFPLNIWHDDIAVGLTGAFLCAKYMGP